MAPLPRATDPQMQNWNIFIFIVVESLVASLWLWLVELFELFTSIPYTHDANIQLFSNKKSIVHCKWRKTQQYSIDRDKLMIILLHNGSNNSNLPPTPMTMLFKRFRVFANSFPPNCQSLLAIADFLFIYNSYVVKVIYIKYVLLCFKFL